MKTVFSRTVLGVAVWAVAVATAAAPAQHSRAYTKEQPLVYEDVWDLWPYSFLNDSGAPDGFNIDLLRMVMKELDIPYVIRLRPMQEAYNDLRDGKSDLMMGLAVGFHDEYGQFGRTSVTLFTQSAVSPKDDEVEVSRFRDLAGHRVYVYDGSLCHHLMADYGWGGNAIAVNDMREAIQQMSAEGKGIMVWNTLSLKWLLRRYHIDNLELTPVDMPHGEYKFMSNDPLLLSRIDSAYTQLNASEKLTSIQNKWFYPERQEKQTPLLVWAIGAVVLFLGLLLVFYLVNYRLQRHRVGKQIASRNKRLALILQTSHVRVWTYDVATDVFTRRNENGLPAYTYTSDEFANRYHPGDFLRLQEALKMMAQDVSPTSQQHDEKEVRIEVRAMDAEEGDTEERIFNVTLSVLDRDKNGRPVTILGTKRDISEERREQRLASEHELRYWAIFNTPMVGITFYNRDGLLANINQKGCDIFSCNRDEILAEGVTFCDVFDLDPGTDIVAADGLHFSHLVDLDRIPQAQRRVHTIKRRGRLCQEVRLMTVFGERGEVIGLFGICRDITDRTSAARQKLVAIKDTEAANAKLTDYVSNINYVLRAGGMRIAIYSPASHTLTIYSGINEVQQALTQTRCMTLVDDRSKKKAMRMLNSMDNGTANNIDTDVRTTIRTAGGQMLQLDFHFIPIFDRQDSVTEYFGLCRDITQTKATEQRLAEQTAKAQEVETAKNSFLRNMSYEIRTPLNAVVGFAELFEEDHATEDEHVFINEILDNSDKLLHLINNILFLSRIDAGMVEIDKQPTDFPAIFETNCTAGWEKHRRDGVKYVVESPYERLVVDIDATNLGHIIYEVAANSAAYTPVGNVRARYDYIGRKLRISIEDTGDGMAQPELDRIFERFAKGSAGATGGLGLPIAKELTELMGGTLEISSDLGLGTTVWITIPCTASDLKRKKII